MERALVPELLDELPHDDPRAARSRVDLRRINWLMAQAPIMASLLRSHLPRRRPLRLLEIGAGDGTPAMRLARRLAPHLGPDTNVHVVLLDVAPGVRVDAMDAIRSLGWSVEAVTADAFAWLGRGEERSGRPFDAIISNLFLHHFEGEALRRLLTLVARRATLFAATEPRRDRPSLLAARLTALIGANDVTRHDAPASVRAGFTGNELGAAWRAAGGGEVLREGRRGPFTHAFLARSDGA